MIVDARNKAPVCKKEQIDIFIDDKLNNCIDVGKEGIQTIKISDDDKKYTNIISLKDWKEIYRFISNEKNMQNNKY